METLLQTWKNSEQSRALTRISTETYGNWNIEAGAGRYSDDKQCDMMLDHIAE